jgi:lysophospholipase L1-like esterase
VIALAFVLTGVASALTAPAARPVEADDASAATAATGVTRTSGTNATAGSAVASAVVGVLAAVSRRPADAMSRSTVRIPDSELRSEPVHVIQDVARPPIPMKTARPATREPARMPAGSTAVFLGDSFTSGWNGAGLGRHGWPAIVASSRGWRAVNLAVPGTGFLNPGWTSQPLSSRLATAVRLKPDIVFIASGHNDSRWSASATADAADTAIRRLRRALPDAVFVIVAPIWQDGSPPQRCLILRDRLRARAAAIGAIFIDPLADRWFAGTRHQLIGPDRLHPTDAGHRFMAARVLAAVARAD